MRQIFSLRFFAAIGAVVGLFALLTLAFGDRESLADRVTPDLVTRDVDVVARVQFARIDGFAVESGRSVGAVELVLDSDRTVRIVEGTHGQDDCPDLRRSGSCAVVADVLGDAVVWFALVPMGPRDTVVFPAIDVLDGDRAQLVNGWRLRYAPALDRRCAREFASYRELRDEIGTAFTTIYSLEDDRLEAVVCDPT